MHSHHILLSKLAFSLSLCVSAVVTIAALAQCGGMISRNGCRGPTCPGGCALQQCRVHFVCSCLHFAPSWA